MSPPFQITEIAFAAAMLTRGYQVSVRVSPTGGAAILELSPNDEGVREYARLFSLGQLGTDDVRRLSRAQRAISAKITSLKNGNLVSPVVEAV